MKLKYSDLKVCLQIAKDLEPEYNNWSFGDHSWCLDSVLEIEKYLNQQGYLLQARSPYSKNHMNLFADQHWYHSWIEFADGTIFDPTIKQFFLPNHSKECKENCKSIKCEPYLSNEFFYPCDHWVLLPGEINRHLYLYSDQNAEVVGNALDNLAHPLL